MSEVNFNYTSLDELKSFVDKFTTPTNQILSLGVADDGSAVFNFSNFKINANFVQSNELIQSPPTASGIFDVFGYVDPLADIRVENLDFGMLDFTNFQADVSNYVASNFDTILQNYQANYYADYLFG